MSAQTLDLSGERDPEEINEDLEPEIDDDNERKQEFRGSETTEPFDLSDALDEL